MLELTLIIGQFWCLKIWISRFKETRCICVTNEKQSTTLRLQWVWVKSNMDIRVVLFVTNDTNWCGSPDDVLVLILSNERNIQDKERCGDAKQANNKNNLPHSMRHEHNARTAGHCEHHQGHKMGVLPHAHFKGSKGHGYEPHLCNYYKFYPSPNMLATMKFE